MAFSRSVRMSMFSGCSSIAVIKLSIAISKYFIYYFEVACGSNKLCKLMIDLACMWWSRTMFGFAAMPASASYIATL